MSSSKKLYVYEQVMSRAEFKRLTGRVIVTDKQWQKFCESMSDALEATAVSVIRASTKKPE